MDDSAQPADSPAPSPAKGKPVAPKKTTGRGISKKTARRAAAANARRGAGRGRGGGPGRGRNKTYDSHRVQAAYERQKELRELYSEVAGAAKPALEDLADLTVKKLLENPNAHEEVLEYQILQQQLDDQLAAVIRSADQEFNTRTAITTRQYELNTAVSEKKFLDSYNYSTEEFYDASLNRTSILEELRNEGCGVDIVDKSYTYVQESDDIVFDQGPYVYLRGDGLKIPFPSLLKDEEKEEVKKAVIKPQSHPQPQPKKAKPAPKRKAEGPPESQPDSKKPAAAVPGSSKLTSGEDASTPRPRHIGGLLSAENEPDAEPESNAPSPTPNNDGQSPGLEPKADPAVKRKDVPDLPSGAAEPDAWDVRTVNRRGPRANNRIIIPPPFEWDDDEIGFRDSTNDSTRKATRGTRGVYLNKPNSRYHHLDRTIVTYDCLEYGDGDLDATLVEKHNLHPKYGLFMPDSVNDSEPPGEHVNSTKPVVVITPNGTTLHASRSVKAMKMDRALQEEATRAKLSSMLSQFCKETDIDPDEITTNKIRERKRQAIERLVSTAVSDEDEDVAGGEHSRSTDATAVDDSVARASTNQLLSAAAYLDAEQPLSQLGNQRSSRPYDAVRDVFTSSEPVPPPPTQPLEVDTIGLSYLADVAEHVAQQPEHHQPGHHQPGHHQPGHQQVGHHQPEQHHELQFVHHTAPMYDHRLDGASEQMDMPVIGDSSMIDPRLLGVPIQASAPSNAFLKTALNPAPAFAHIAPAPVGALEAPPQPSTGRIPFTTQGSSRGSPVLPPLRPTRRDHGPDASQPPQAQPQPQPQEFGSPHMMVHTNSGNFYPPAPPRPFHQSYSIHEHHPLMLMPMPMSMQQQGPPMASASMLPNQGLPPPPPHYGGSYQVMTLSPPMHSHAQLANMPGHIAAAPPVSPPGPPMGVPLSPAHATRHRASIPSSSSAAKKYRSIAAAPIPHNQPWQGSGGRPALRLAHYDHKEAIKDYPASEPPPRSGPTQIRGWSINNAPRGRNKGYRKEDTEEKDSPNITSYINKWNPSDKSLG
ncbi:Uu.00g082010.m01.CDS01 [Anthostomella pinea]|uniref:Uu.00g082010.m01.CDS01 n=1 Tax=Anthostomella pinea TaxID=933095 RepID=A0AAI8VMF9_9PEZI|nr:Uu.00g082010.m01.CDS01 [Anthostomella pinea]